MVSNIPVNCWTGNGADWDKLPKKQLSVEKEGEDNQANCLQWLLATLPKYTTS